MKSGLGFLDAVCIIVGIVIGTTIFKVPNLIFASCSDPWVGLIVWGVGGILALIGALCYAELATMYPRAGGDYYYLTRAFGPGLGFLFGWAQLLIVFTASIGAMVFVFGEYATKLYDLSKVIDLESLDQNFHVGLTSEVVYAAGAVAALTLLNILGVVLGKWAQNFLMLIKIVSVAAIVVVGFGWAQSNPLDWTFGQPGLAPDLDHPSVPGVVGWGTLAMILVLYAYGGWNDAAFVAAEVRNPQRNIPRALIVGVGLITVVYLLINAAYLVGLGYADASKFGVPARLLERAFPEWGGRGVSILIVISALGAANGLIFTGARVYATLGNDYLLFNWLGHWRPGKRAPILALLAQLIVTIGIIFMLGTQGGHREIDHLLGFIYQDYATEWTKIDPFVKLLDHTAPVFWLFFMLTGFSLFLLRAKDSGAARPFSVPFYPWLPIIFCLTCAFMLYQSILYVQVRALFAFALLLLGIPFYWLSRLIGGYRGDALKPLEGN